jgi:hypothetical protein
MLKRYAARFRDFLNAPLLLRRASVQYPDAASQLHLQMGYRALAESGKKLPGLGDVGFKCFSQTDEDGILLYLFALLGTQNKLCLELCAGDGIECNCANLIVHHGWHGLLIDGDKGAVERGRDFYSRNPHTYVYPPLMAHAWVTRDNVNDLIRSNGLEGEIDLMSLDMDGVDYWIWKAMTVVQPRVVVVEYQDIIGPEKALTVPYSEDFNAYEHPTTLGMPNFCGASLPAFVKLAKAKGYRLVGCNRYGYNAFFVRNDLGEAVIPEVSAKSCFTHPKVLWGMKERFPSVKDHPWVEV